MGDVVPIRRIVVAYDTDVLGDATNALVKAAFKEIETVVEAMKAEALATDDPVIRHVEIKVSPTRKLLELLNSDGLFEVSFRDVGSR